MNECLQLSDLHEIVDFESGVTDIVVTSSKTIVAITEVQQRRVFSFHSFKQWRL